MTACDLARVPAELGQDSIDVGLGRERSRGAWFCARPAGPRKLEQTTSVPSEESVRDRDAGRPAPPVAVPARASLDRLRSLPPPGSWSVARLVKRCIAARQSALVGSGETFSLGSQVVCSDHSACKHAPRTAETGGK